jgi:NADH-quinone oxidoreductase subunit N
MTTPTAIQAELLNISDTQLSALMPFLVVFGGAVLGMFTAVMKKMSPKWPTFFVTVATCAVGLYLSCAQTGMEPVSIFGGMMVVDRFSVFFNMLFLGAALATTLLSFRYLDDEKLQYPEYYLLLLFSTIGMMLLTSSMDLIVLFISLEIMSIMVYVLVGFRRADRKGNEAAVKYFILGGAASAILLYGIALLYGATGSMNLRAILEVLTAQNGAANLLYTLGIWLVFLGFLFKVAAVPFHMWMPDVYEGAPVPITGFMTTALKAAAFGVFVRVFVGLGYGKLPASLQVSLEHILWGVAVLTMLIGNAVALTQTNLKRMLAYSSIAHTGYILIGFLAASKSADGYAPVVMYLSTYAVMNLGAFGLLTVLAAREDHGLNLHDLSGLSKRKPWLAFAMAVFMFSMSGMPLTAGFASKYLMFAGAVQAGYIWLVVLGVLCSAIAVYYYLRVLVYMYMRDPLEAPSAHRVPIWAAIVLIAAVAATFYVGILPSGLMSAAKAAVSQL